MDILPLSVFTYVQTLFLPYTLPLLTLTSVAASVQLITPAVAITATAYTVLIPTAISIIVSIPSIAIACGYKLYTWLTN